MLSLSEILKSHARKYPEMQPRDAVKLLYQNEFGGGHLIRDSKSCLQYLLREYASTPQDPSVPLLEEIGNGMVRVSLSALDSHGYPPEQLCQDFIRSAGLCGGSRESFLEKLRLLSKLTAAGQMPFLQRDLQAYLAAYAADGYPMVSHSDQYRKTYSPAYRVLLKSCLPDNLR